MRRFLLGAALCLGGPAHAQFGTDPAKTNVIIKDEQLKRAEQLSRWAEQMKSIAADKALSAKQRAEMARRRRKERAVAEAQAARMELNRAERTAAQKRQEVNQTSLEYLQAEDDHHARNGTYVKPQQYRYLKQKLRYESAAEAPAEVTHEAVTSQRAELQSRLESGKPVGAGELMGRASQIKQMGYGVIKKSLDTDYSAAMKGARPPAGGAPPSAPTSARAPGGVPRLSTDSLGSGTAALLRKPVGDNERAAAKRFLSAGRDSLDLGDAQAALLAAEEAVSRDPNNPQAWGLKADALNALGRFAEAEAAAQRSVDLDPGNAKGLRALVWAQLHNKKAAEAAANATKLIRLDPENAESFLLRAFAYELGGDRERMLADLRTAAGMDPRFANHLARALAGLRLFDPDGDNSSLMGMLAPPPLKKIEVPWGVLGLLALAGSAGYAAWRRRESIEAFVRERLLARRTVGSGVPVRATAEREEQSLLAGKYRLDRVAGQGGMGKVWKAFDPALQREVAIKEMSAAAVAKPQFRALYLKEARALAALPHPNLVEIFEVIETPTQVYLVMEWVSGKTLHHVLAEKGALDLEAAKAVLSPVCEALATAHAHGLVHRDLKPANVMVASSGRVKLIDFGLARELGREEPEGAEPAGGAAGALTATRTRSLAGTPAYRPPEALEGLISPAFDVFSLGVCLYELLTRRLPFGAEGLTGDDAKFVPASELVSGLSRGVDALLSASLTADREARLSRVASFHKALKAL